MPAHRFDDDWFMKHRGRLLVPRQGLSRQRKRALVHGLLEGSRLGGLVPQDTEGALRHLAPRHANATRAHMQLYRACLESTGLVPADALVQAAVQVEWLWYTTPFKRFYRDHLAHVMKVAATGLWLLEDEASPLAPSGSTLVDWLAERLAEGVLGAEALRAAAAWCGIPVKEQNARFWKSAMLESVRLAGLLHDMAYPDVMSWKVARAAAPVLSHADSVSPWTQAIVLMTPHLAMTPFNQGRLTGPLPLAEEDRRAAELVIGDSHSLRGARTLLRFMESTHAVCPLDPIDTFILEWAALAIALHDYDKFHALLLKRAEKDSPKEAQLRKWLGRRENLEAIRPRFQVDPVSYVVALADQLQDFGRMNYVAVRGQTDAGGDVASLRVRYPCRAVELNTDGAFGALDGTVRFVFGTEAEQPFGIGRKEAEEAAEKKAPAGKPESIFGPEGWFDHAGLLRHLTVDVAHGEELLARSKAT